ncbi:ABC transporter permease [Chitinophaga arvensicola]|uniref:Putative ABC transport system permease protein n=1 Tax=Chitinophaga arvensicola TaxID=29529 RepID=A0A1I0S7K4_9BACT|nr:ABC transporter permease [Chitinophaga arvensicola]SEW51666.1 putative ABC transport system permease protein [Chitinophaga arvensicola]
MFSNYTKIALRHHWKNKLYGAIHVSGLAIGITTVLLAVLYLKNEHSFDAFHKQNPHLYRITTTVTPPGGNGQLTGNTGQLQGPVFKEQVPEITAYSRVMGGDIYGDMLAGDKVLKQQLLFVDESFLQMFSFPLVKGDAATALRDAGSAVITERTALKYFNRTDVVGQLLRMDADPSARRLGKPLVITGVVKDPPLQSSIQFDVLLPFRFLQLSFEDNDWNNMYLSTFVVTRADAGADKVTAQLNRVQTRYAGGKDQPKLAFGLQPITGIHLHPLYAPGGSREGGVINGSHPAFSYIFLGIALFILLMAGINFINITLAGSLKRIKEVGVRKINGSSSIQIVLQFLVESGLLCTLAMILALLLSFLALPVFNDLSGAAVPFRAMLDPLVLLSCAGLLAGIVLLTGIYPAYVLARFSAMRAFSGKAALSARNPLGRALIVTQFSLAVFFLLITVFFYRQMAYIQTKDLGYHPEQVVVTHINGDRDVQQVAQLLKNELRHEPGVLQLSFGGARSGLSDVKLGAQRVPALHQVVDQHYLPAMGITLISGENFGEDWSNGAIVNEAFVRAAGLSHPIGTPIRTDEYFDKELRTITGVVKDFHAGSLREKIAPMVMINSKWFGGGVWVKLAPNREKQGLAALAAAYKKVMPESAFTYSFLNDLNAREYVQEQRWQRIIGWATLLSVLICCSGLFGLAHIATHQRIKEIGIRKILGAGMAHIVGLFSKDFLRLVMIAFTIAAPLAWIAMHQWLQGFAYRTDLSAWVFIATGLGTLLMALTTVSMQVMRAAGANPVNNLRTQ